MRNVLRLRRHVLDQVRGDLGASRRQQVRAHRGTAGADAVVLGDLGCMLNIEGRLRRRGDSDDQGAARGRGTCGRASGLTAIGPSANLRNRPMQVASMHFKERAHVKLNDERLQEQPQEDARASSSPSGGRRSSELDDFEATREAGKAIRQRALDDLDVWLEIFEAQRDGARARRCFSRRRPPRSTRWCSRSPRATACARSSSRNRWCPRSPRSTMRSRRPDLTVVETDLGEYILQINDYEPPSHIIGPALHKTKEEVAELFHARHGTPRKDRDRGTVPRGARRAARALSDRRHGDLRRQFLRGRDRLGRARDQRGQRDAGDDVAQGARRDIGHREARAHARGRRDADAAACRARRPGSRSPTTSTC